MCILRTFRQPTGVLCQQGPLLWIYPHISPNKTLEYYPSAVAQLAMLGVKSCIQHFGILPNNIIYNVDIFLLIEYLY